VNALAVLLLVAAFGAAAALVVASIRRSSLGVWHPAVAWLTLHAAFFGIGSAILALDGRAGPALFVAGATVAFGLGVAASDWLARRRSRGLVASGEDRPDRREADAGRLRPVVVASLAGFGIVLIAPMLIRSGLPFFAGDITGARSELAGLPLQVLRVAVPALALSLLLEATGRRLGRRGLVGVGVVIAGLVAFDLALASRYLAAELLAVMLVGMGLAGVRVSTRVLAPITLAAVLAFGSVQVLRAYEQAAGRELAFALERTVNRIVLIQPRTLEALQAAIPDEEPYFGGLTWARRAGPSLGRTDIPNLGYWIYPRMFPNQVERGYAAPGIVGEAWANFGPSGLGLFVLLGAAVERLGGLLARRRLGSGDIVAGALSIVFVARTHALGVNGLAVLLALVIAWRVLAAGGWRTFLGDLRAVAMWRA
jgi:hypothetical protein